MSENDEIRAGDRFEGGTGAVWTVEHARGARPFTVLDLVSGGDSGTCSADQMRTWLRNGVYKRLPREAAKPAMPEAGRRVRVTVSVDGRTFDGRVVAAHHAADTFDLELASTMLQRFTTEGARWSYLDDPRPAAKAPRRAESAADLRPGMRVSFVGDGLFTSEYAVLENGRCAPPGASYAGTVACLFQSAADLGATITILSDPPEAKPVEATGSVLGKNTLTIRGGVDWGLGTACRPCSEDRRRSPAPPTRRPRR
jgi:hypothetical protein